MYKSSAKSQQRQSRTGNESTKGSGRAFSLLGGGANPAGLQDEAQEQANLKAALVRQLEQAKLKHATAKAAVQREARRKGPAFFAALAERNDASTEIQRMVAALSDLKAQRQKALPIERLERHFVDLCEETLPRAQFRVLLAAARRRAEQAAQAKPKRRRFVPLTPGGSLLAHLEADNEQAAWQNLLEDASHMPYRTAEDFRTRGYTVTELEGN